MECQIREQPESNWMRRVLLAAGFYNLLWGAAVIAFPSGLFQFAGMELPRYPQIWQCVGMIVGVYGIGYLIAATDPLRHWPITLVGLLGKIFGPIGFANALWTGSLPLAFGATIITNDLIWWVPFSAILYQAFKRQADSSTTNSTDLARALTSVDSHRGATLSALSWTNPTLVVLLRHTGCTFCRETLADLKAQRQTLESGGVTLALVHMSDPLEATRTMSRYGLDSVHRFSDPQCELYQAFGLPRGFVPATLRYQSMASRDCCGDLRRPWCWSNDRRRAPHARRLLVGSRQDRIPVLRTKRSRSTQLPRDRGSIRHCECASITLVNGFKT